MGLPQLRKVFAMEAEDRMQDMENALLQLEQDAADQEAVSSLFRAVHTVKGSAGVVGLDDLSAFMHKVENFLDPFRAGEKQVGPVFIKLMLACHDCVQSWLVHIAEHAESAPELEENVRLLLEQIGTYAEEKSASPEKPITADKTNTAEKHVSETAVESVVPVQSDAVYKVRESSLDEGLAEAENWHISLRFTRNTLKNGIEPLDALHYLTQSGEITHLITLFDDMPSAEEMEPDLCYLGFELGYKSELDKEGIERLFEIIHEHCQLRILPPHSRLSHYIKLIEELPEDTMKLGEILIKSGTLTRRELEQGLSQQSAGERLGDILIEQGAVQADVVKAAVEKQKDTQTLGRYKHLSLHVDARKLDQLIDLVGELVIANAGMILLARDIKEERLKKTSRTMSRLVEEIRKRSLSMRMVPIGETFARFQRIVRDAGRELDKQIKLQISGADTELDKSIVERIADPLVHLVRNAVDHGIETRDERFALGKPEAGHIHLNARHDSGNIIIEIEDDGRGLDRAKIRAAALRKGLLEEEQDISEEALYHFIFEPDFSTSEKVTELSGRGVGLDVVKRSVSALNGAISINSEKNRGTHIQIHLPLTMAIIDGFLLRVGASVFAVPLDRVVRCVKYTAQYQQEAKSGYINLQGSVLPIISLRRLLAMRSVSTKKRRNIVIVRHGEQCAGLLVDELLGEAQAVVKPLGKIFEKLAGISGATILGDGEVALILDVPALIAQYARTALPKQEVPACRC